MLRRPDAAISTSSGTGVPVKSAAAAVDNGITASSSAGVAAAAAVDNGVTTSACVAVASMIA